MKELDLFAQQFSFDVQRGKKDRGTRIGTFLSLSILGISFAYLCYLLYRFFTHANPPAVSTITSINKNPTSVNFDYPLVQLQFNMPDGENNENFFEVFSWVQDFSLQNQSYIEPVPLAYCSDYSYLGDQTIINSNQSYCLQPEQASQIRQSQKNLNLQRKLWVIIGQCNITASTPNCQNDQSASFFNNLNTLLNDERFSITLSVQLKTLDTESGNIIDVADTRKIILDPSIVETVFSNLQRSIMKVDQGFLFQDIKTTTIVQSYQERSVFQSSNFVYDYYNEEIFYGMYYGMCIALQEADLIQNVVYEKVASPLAQFVSIMNILLVFGILAKIVSDARIFSMLIDRYLSVYFLSTASQYKMQQAQENIIKRQRQQPIDAVSPEPVRDLDQIGQLETPSLSQNAKKFIKNQQKIQIEQQNNDIKEKLKIKEYFPDENEKILRLSLINAFKIQNKAPKILQQIQKGEKTEALTDLSRAEQIYAMIFEDSQHKSAFTNIYGDLLALKNGLQITLTEEQYAAMKFVGRSLDNIIDNKVDYDLLNHLERLERIDRDEQLRQELLISFIRKGYLGNFDGLNKRLYDCLVEKLKDPSIWSGASQAKNEQLKGNFGNYESSKLVNNIDISQ